MIVDVVTYNGEQDLWDLRYNVLKDYVDEFVVVEFDRTFSGNRKSFTFDRVYPKVRYIKHHLKDYAQYRDLALSSPNTVGATHWKLEFMQKESVKDALALLKDNDLVFVGDVDEIWSPKILQKHSFPVKLKLDVYTYYLNSRSSEEFWGTLVSPWYLLKDKCLNHMRTRAPKSKATYGWHFTSMGGVSALKQKLTDSYTQESYATPQVLENLAYNIENGRDFLGRDFTYRIDESAWPKHLKDNRERYSHLMKDGVQITGRGGSK